MKSLTLTTLLFAAALAVPAEAATLAGQFHMSSIPNRPIAAAAAAEDDSGLCGVLHAEMQTYEKEADRAGGTAAAAKWSKLADKVWSNGQAVGCGWAQ